MQRVTGSISLDPAFLNNTMKVSINAKAMNTENNFGDAGAIGSAVNMDPTQVIKDGSETYGGYYQWANYGANLGTPNPVQQLLEVDNRSSVQRAIANVQVDYLLPLISGLRANLNLATDYTESNGYNNRPATTPSVLTNPTWGRLTDYYGKNYNNLLDFYLNYNKDLDKIYSRINATAGYSWQHFQREGSNYARGIVDDSHPYQKADSSAFITENYLVSFFG
jgi:iron complex outermembrane receptor protein